MRRRTVVAGVFALALVGVVIFCGRRLLGPRAVTDEDRRVAQAICDFRAENGVLPDDLQELVPKYLPAVASDSSLFYTNGILAIPAGWPHTYITYSFNGPNEGWVSGGDCGGGPLPIARVTPSVVPVTGDDLVRARLAVYDRRIGASSKNLRPRTAKMSYLVSLGRKEDAYSECLAAASAHPDWWRAQMGLATLAPPEEATAAEARFRSWVDGHPAFVHYWYLAQYHRERGRTKDAVAALRQGAHYPLEDVDPDAGWVPHFYAFNAATFACKQREPELVLAITDAWASPRGAYNYPSPDLPAFKAAAELALGELEEARADADKVIATSRERAMWARNLDQLDAAIRREDRYFVYDPGPPCCGGEWSLFPPPE